MDNWITIFCLLVVAATSGAAVFHDAFDDSLIQRICLTGFCLGALGMAWFVYGGNQASGPLQWGAVFAALYGIETWRCVLRKRLSNTTTSNRKADT